MTTATFQLTEADYVAFLRLYYRRYRPMSLAILFGASLLLVIVGWQSQNWAMTRTVIGTMFALAIVYGLALHYWLLPRHAAKTWADYALIKEPVTLTVNATGVRYEQPSAHVDVQWHSALLWDEDDVIFAVFATRQLAYIFPKRVCDAALLTAVRDGLVASGLTDKGKLRK